MAGNLLGSIVPGLGNVVSVIVGFVVEIEIGILHEWQVNGKILLNIFEMVHIILGEGCLDRRIK